jgi:hypothetical protein
MLQTGRLRVRFPITSLRFSIDPMPSAAALVDSVSNRNEYEESSWGLKVRPERKADNLTANYEPIV